MDNLQATQCPLCLNASHDAILYPANFNYKDLNAHVFSARRLPDRVHYRTVRCRRCGVVRGDPILTTAALAQLYAQCSSGDEKISAYAALTYGKLVTAHLPTLNKNEPLLEIGCGRGYFLSWLQQQGFTKFLGCEPSKEAVSCSGLMKPYINPQTIEQANFPPQSFNAIFAFHVFDHVSDPVDFLNKVHSQLKTSGTLMMVMHDSDALLARILGEHCPMIDIEHPFLYNTRAIKIILERHGFKVIKQINVVNTYPLSYWLGLAPLPQWLKKQCISNSLLERLPLSMALGNQGLIAKKI